MRSVAAAPRRAASFFALVLCALLVGQTAAGPARAEDLASGPTAASAAIASPVLSGATPDAAPSAPRAAATGPLTVGIAQLATAYDPTTNQATVAVTVSVPDATVPFSYTVAVRGTAIATGSASEPVTITATNPCSVYSVSLTVDVTDAAGLTGSAATTLSRTLCPPPPAVPHALDRIKAGATLTQASFVDRLRAMGSPALSQGAAIYQTLVAGRINPAFALGTFQAESGSGTRGYAVTTHNWGNILYHSWEAAYGAVPYAPGNGYTYALYPDWLSSIRAYVQLLTWYDEDGYITVSSASAHWLGTTEGSSRHLTYLTNITNVMSALPDDAIPVMRSLTAPAYSRAVVTVSYAATDNVLVAGYQLRWRLGSGAYTPSVETTATSQAITLTAGVWTIAVRAIDDAGNFSTWRTVSVRVDTTAPVMTKLTANETIIRTVSGRITLRWSAWDAVGVTGYQLRLRRRSTGVWSSPIGTTATSRVLTLAPDTWYVGVRARDAAGNLSAWREVRLIVPVDDRSYAFSAGTTRRTSSVDYHGTTTTTSRGGASLATTFSGTGVYVVGRAGPAYGRFVVTVDGRATIVDSGYYGGRRATTTHVRAVLFSATLRAGVHSLTIRNLGTAGRPTIALDGIAFAR